MNCSALRDDQSTCKAYAMTGSGFCYLHNPDISQVDKREAQARGGRGNKETPAEPLPPVTLRDTSDVISLIEKTINEVRAGTLDVKTANCLGYLAGHFVKAVEISELEKRLGEIEEAVKATSY